MRVLIISTYFAPEHTGNAPYVTQLAEYLSRFHEVTVIASHPHYPEWKVWPGWNRWRSVERSTNMRVIRLSHYVPAKQDFIRRFAYELTWAGRALAEARRHPADVVLGVTPTLLTAHVARWTARRHGAKCALMVQDIVSRTAAQSGIRGGRRIASLVAKLERAALASVDGICTIHPRFAQLMTADFGVPATALHVVYNWSHIRQPNADRAITRRELGWADATTVVLHSGNMGNKQDLLNVVAAGRLAQERGEQVLFVLAGDGNQRAALEQASAGLSTVSVRGAVPDDQFANFLAAADVLLVNERADVLEMSVPSKLTSYLTVGRPVLAATESAGVTAELLLASGGGVVVRPGDPAALLGAVLDLAGDPLLIKTLGNEGQRFAESELSSAPALTSYRQWLESFVDQ
jgi:colanic acid biosynthesis glycosyl transferase WcaI